MKVLIETMALLDNSIKLSNDNISIYRVNTDNIFDEDTIVLNKYSMIIQQMYYKDWVFINTIFSFLLKLKKGGQTIYYKKLHTKILEWFKEFLKHNKYIIYVYEANQEIVDYLEEYCFEYTQINSSKELISKINNIF